MRHISLRLALLVSLSFATVALRAGTITLTTTNDTTLNAGSPSNNLGGATTMIVGTTAAEVRNRALLRFDIAAAIPAKATIKSVTLSLVDVSGSTTFTRSNFELHRLLVNWGEGGKAGALGAAATEGEATWLHRFSTNRAWTLPGAAATTDFTIKPSASLSMSVGGQTNVWKSTPDLVADVQGWLNNPSRNFGWLLRSDAENSSVGTARRFGTRESAQGRGPKLAVEFTPPP